MTNTGKTLSTRLSAEELDELEELGRQLGTNPTDTLKLAIFELRKATGLLKLDSIALTERIARLHGDDCKVKFRVADVGTQVVDVTVDGDPVEDIEAYVLYATVKLRGKIVPPDAGTIVAKDLQTGLYYAIGQVPLKQGAIIELELSKLPDRLQDDDGLTPEQRRDHIRKNAQIRAAARQARGEPDDDEEAPLDDD